jgi:hypothetical protein
MTEEIKEILEALKPHNDIKEYPLYLNRKQQDLLYDYITNLQQENEKLKLDVKYWENKWQNTRFANNQVKVLQDTVIKSANNTNKAMEQTEIYKLRCEKAIEYIKDKGLYEEELDIFNDDINYNELDDLLNILNGSDENETNN